MMRCCGYYFLQQTGKLVRVKEKKGRDKDKAAIEENLLEAAKAFRRRRSD